MGRRPVTFQWVVIHGKPWKVHKSTGTVNLRTAQSGWHWPMIGVSVGESWRQQYKLQPNEQHELIVK